MKTTLFIELGSRGEPPIDREAKSITCAPGRNDDRSRAAHLHESYGKVGAQPWSVKVDSEGRVTSKRAQLAASLRLAR